MYISLAAKISVQYQQGLTKQITPPPRHKIMFNLNNNESHLQ